MHVFALLGTQLALAALGAASLLAAEAPATFNVGEFTFTRPEAWQWVQPRSSMRAAQMQITGTKESETADVIFFHFGPGDGGGTQANVDRWLGQFQEPKDKLNAKVEEVSVGKRKVTYVQAEGTFSGGMVGHPAPAIPKATLLGAILESAQGNVFIKLTGPSDVVRPCKAAFRMMTESGLQSVVKE